MSATTGVAEPLLALDEIGARLECALTSSAADETEIVWLENCRGWAASRGQRLLPPPRVERLVMVRVLERGRAGLYRTGDGSPAELDAAVRLALAHARAAAAPGDVVHLPAPAELPGPTPDLADLELAQLTPEAALERLLEHAQPRETAVLEWVEGRVAVANSRGLARLATVTAVNLEVQAGRRPGAGAAAAASRHLGGVDFGAIFQRARDRHGRGPVADLPPGSLAVVLSGEAAAELVRLLREAAFAASSYLEGRSFLCEYRGVQVFDRAITVADDGTDPGGFPLPFDLEGTPKRRIELVAAGTPLTPALDPFHGLAAGLPATAHAVAGGDALPDHLFLLPGVASEAELLASAEGGIWIGRLERIECYDPRRMRIRARGRGVRRIAGGALADSLPDLVWEDSLLRAFAEVAGIGRDPVVRPLGDGWLGAVCAPPLALRDVAGLTAEPGWEIAQS